MEVISFARIDARRLGQKTLDVQEIECGNAEEALQLGSAGEANQPIEVWCGPRRLGRFEPERR